MVRSHASGQDFGVPEYRDLLELVRDTVEAPARSRRAGCMFVRFALRYVFHLACAWLCFREGPLLKGAPRDFHKISQGPGLPT